MDTEIELVRWTEDVEEHLATRTQRYPDVDEIDLRSEWATEAALDPDRFARTSESGSVEVVGLSRTAPPMLRVHPGRVLRVWLRPSEEVHGLWFGRSACTAPQQMADEYWRLNGYDFNA